VSGSTRIALTVAAVLLAAPSTSGAAAPAVESMVVGRSAVLAPAAKVPAPAATISAGSRRCRVGEGTPLAALAAVRRAGGPAFRVRDYGSCSSRPRDAAGLFVNRIGSDGNRGQDGWVYKVGDRVGTTPAADLGGPFGTGRRIRSGQRVLWFWCEMGASGCQRTLDVDTTVGPGSVTVRVRGADDRGRSVPVAGATVAVGAGTGTTDADGVAVFAGLWDGSVTVTAAKQGLVPSFPEEASAR
jgi:hypothetical protein